MSRHTRANARPRLEELESRDVPSYLAAEFPGHGVWQYHTAGGGTWTQLTTNDASQVAANGIGEVLADFPGQGVWLASYHGWKQLTPANATGLALVSARGFDQAHQPYQMTGIVAEFPGQGLWPASSATSAPRPPTRAGSSSRPPRPRRRPSTPTAAYAASFTGQGVWFFGEAGWRQLTGVDATSLAAGAPADGSGPSAVAAAFAGYGLWRFQDGGGWVQLTAANASMVGINDNSDVVAEFPGWGVWTYFDSNAASTAGFALGWHRRGTTEAALVAIDDADNVFGQFNGNQVPFGRGVFIWESVKDVWYYLMGYDVSSLGVGGGTYS